MNIEIGNNTVEMINGLGIKLEEYGVQLFQIAVNQRYVSIGNWLFIVFVVFCLTIIGIKYLDFIKNNEADGSAFITIFGIIIYIVMLFVLFIMTFDMIQWALNPEYAAIKELRYLVR